MYMNLYRFTKYVSTFDLPVMVLATSTDKQTGDGNIKGTTGVLSESPKCLNLKSICLCDSELPIITHY